MWVNSCTALYVLAEEGLCTLLGHVPHKGIISQKSLKGMGRACNLGNWAKKYQQGLGLGQKNGNYGWLARGCCWDGVLTLKRRGGGLPRFWRAVRSGWGVRFAQLSRAAGSRSEGGLGARRMAGSGWCAPPPPHSPTLGRCAAGGGGGLGQAGAAAAERGAVAAAVMAGGGAGPGIEAAASVRARLWKS